MCSIAGVCEAVSGHQLPEGSSDWCDPVSRSPPQGSLEWWTAFLPSRRPPNLKQLVTVSHFHLSQLRLLAPVQCWPRRSGIALAQRSSQMLLADGASSAFLLSFS
jgi:hypothetical protein